MTEAETKWNSIQTAPRQESPGEEIVDLLLFDPESDRMVVAGWVSERGEWCDKWTGDEVAWAPTHWMPLPERPQ